MSVDTTLERQYQALLHRCNLLLEKLPVEDRYKIQGVMLDLFTHYNFVLQSYQESVQKNHFLRAKNVELEHSLRQAK